LIAYRASDTSVPLYTPRQCHRVSRIAYAWSVPPAMMNCQPDVRRSACTYTLFFTPPSDVCWFLVGKRSEHKCD
jgi:hypothetical protein